MSEYVHPSETAVLDPVIANGVPKDILPTDVRIMDKVSYALAWFGGCVCMATFATGANLIGMLNTVQAVTAIIVGNIILAIAMVLCGKAGNDYGIPFSVHLRSSFGFSGAKFPSVLRAVPALIWFGYQSWIGAAAINLILNNMFGFDNIWVCFIAFQALQVFLSLNGFTGIKWLENIAAAFLIITLVYMLVNIMTKFDAEISATVGDIEGSWGWGFWTGVTSFLGIYTALVTNVSDYSRNYVKHVKTPMTAVIYMLGLLPANVMLGIMGLMIAGATGNHDPIAVFSNAIDQPVLLIATLVFILFSQMTTNILNNMVAPIYILIDFFNLKFRPAAIIVGVLSVFTFPWLLVRPESAAGLDMFIHIYAAFLGPLFAVLCVDYYILRKQALNLNYYYDKNGPYKGVNWAGVISIIVGGILSFIVIDISWFVGLIPAGLTYYLLMTKTKLGASYLEGSVFKSDLK